MYTTWDKKILTDFSNTTLEKHYAEGYVFTREAYGSMARTISARIALKDFSLSSENRRILRKTEALTLGPHTLPYGAYDWHIGKMAKDFYDTRAGKNTFSANKIKELLTAKHNFNLLFSFSIDNETPLGYAICFNTENILHYSYPFYDALHSPRDMGLGMMLRAILFAKEKGMSYIYLGSLSRKNDTYKLQFSGLEYYTKDHVWSRDYAYIKQTLHEQSK